MDIKVKLRYVTDRREEGKEGMRKDSIHGLRPVLMMLLGVFSTMEAYERYFH